MRFPRAVVFRLVLICWAFGCVPAGSLFGDDAQGTPREIQAFNAQLREIRESSLSPEEQVARVDALVRANPRQTSVSHQAAKETPIPTDPAANQTLTEDEALKLEAVKIVKETRAAAKSPEEEVALVDEFLRLNNDVLASLRPKPASEAQKAAAEQARTQLLQSRVAKNPGDLEAQAALIIGELRKEARSPEESVALIDEFLRLNQETLEAGQKKGSGKATLQNQTQ